MDHFESVWPVQKEKKKTEYFGKKGIKQAFKVYSEQKPWA